MIHSPRKRQQATAEKDTNRLYRQARRLYSEGGNSEPPAQESRRNAPAHQRHHESSTAWPLRERLLFGKRHDLSCASLPETGMGPCRDAIATREIPEWEA